MVFTIFFSKFASVFNTYSVIIVRKVYGILFAIMLVCFSCEWQLKPSTDEVDSAQITVERYDRIESLYLTTGDYSALQQMNTSYPMQTRMLIEDVLHIGKVHDEAINTKFLHFFQDSTLQKMLADVAEEYADMDDINEELSLAFSRLKDDIPSMEIPQIYAQVGSFDQSIIVGNKTLGISLDKYLGVDYPFYQKHYTTHQRSIMTRDMIVPDCLSFYLLSIYPFPDVYQSSPEKRDMHMGRIQWVVNRVTDRNVFTNTFVTHVDQQMKKYSKMTVEQLLTTDAER